MSGMVWTSVGFTLPLGSKVSGWAVWLDVPVSLAGFEESSFLFSAGLFASPFDDAGFTDWSSFLASALEEAPPPVLGDGFFFPSSDGGVIFPQAQQHQQSGMR